ncbi:hypothetical protein CDAR_235101 [Caerostris darwini]|uniref:Uncharacterized protein n=1 Tax=Caerostris darwini TaxID=1538125 RepID=A0AAV4MPN8_9ARAC|nr:hypothetical protein CDAR_235101 [Caerostris darwini]
MLCLAPKSERKSTQEGKNSRKGVSSAVSLKTTSGTLECGLAHMVSFPYISKDSQKLSFVFIVDPLLEIHYIMHLSFPKWY